MEFVLIAIAPVGYMLLILALRGRLQTWQQGWLLAVGMALLFVLALVRLPAVSEQAVIYSIPWMPQIGLVMSFYVDGLAHLFVLLVTGIGIAVMLYAGYYFDDWAESTRFLAILLAFAASMLALVMAGNLITLFIAWELTSVTSFMLISFKGYSAEARSGASQALMITGGGGLALLVGLMLVGTAVGSYELSEVLASGDLLREHPWYTAIAVLVMIGCFSKSAQFPVHFWLPNAMSAPTPASTFLHSATMVKAGVYLLARFYPVLGDTELWTTGLVTIGLITMFVGAFLALFQRDLKGILAYSTVSQLGALVAMIGLPESAGLKAAMIGILAHAMYKGALFLVAGAVDHATGTRDIEAIGGLQARMRGFAIATLVVGLSMAGVPPMFGFVAKETLLEAFIERPLPLAVIVVSATLTVAVAFRLFWDVFMGTEKLGEAAHAAHHATHDPDDPAHAHHFHALPRLMVASPAALAVGSVVGGIGIAPLIAPVVSSALGKSVSLYLLPPYINLPFILSMGALAAGAGVFLARRAWLRLTLPTIITGPKAYRAVVGLVERFGDLLLLSQGGRIRYYLSAILVAVLILLTTVIPQVLGSIGSLEVVIRDARDLLKVALILVSLVATGASIYFKNHLIAVLALGASGYAVGGLFMLEPAPDVAMVQFLVETLATVLLVVILARTSEQERQRAIQHIWGQTRAGIARDVAISTLMGLAVTIFALSSVVNRPTPNAISLWHLENALPQVGVNSVVAGILTDFRGTDTLIEITVFGMAALGVLTMLARPKPGKTFSLFSRGKPTTTDSNGYKDAIRMDSEQPERIVYRSRFSDPITRLVAILIFPISILLALSHLLYAGSGPGDGFTAGVIGGLGLTLWYVVLGYEETKRRLRWLNPASLIGVGLVIALGNALAPLLFGEAFLSFTPVYGIDIADIKIASSLLFEVGIALTVFGGVSTIMEAISYPKEVESV